MKRFPLKAVLSTTIKEAEFKVTKFHKLQMFKSEGRQSYERIKKYYSQF